MSFEMVEIGGSKLFLGDCREILPTLEAVDAVVTDPPYGIGWKRGLNSARNSKPHDGIANDHDTTTRDDALRLIEWKYGFVFGSFYAPFPELLKQVLIWHKPPDSGIVGSVTGFRRDAEPIFMVGSWPVRTVDRSSVIHFPGGQAATVTETGHPHTKPIALIKTLVEKTSGVVLDPFMGSGTTGVACAQLGREFIGIEIDPNYFRVACARIKEAQKQPDLFVVPKQPQPEQETLL